MMPPAGRRRCEDRLAHAGRDASAWTLLAGSWSSASERDILVYASQKFAWRTSKADCELRSRRWAENSASSVASRRPGAPKGLSAAETAEISRAGERFIFPRTALSEAARKKATNSMACEGLDQVTACPRLGLKAASWGVLRMLPRSQQGAGASCSPELRGAARVGRPDVAAEACSFPLRSGPDQPPEAGDGRHNRQKLAALRVQTSLLVTSP
jgi:hypothetical protein